MKNVMLLWNFGFTILSARWISCSITGISYMDSLENTDSYERGYDHEKYPRGEDPCNPLYWYPRKVPEYCKFRQNNDKTERPDHQKKNPVPVPIPVPIEPEPAPFLFPVQYHVPMSFQAPVPMPVPPPPVIPPPAMSVPIIHVPAPIQLAPLPYGIAIQPSAPMVPILAHSYPSYRIHLYQSPHIPRPIFKNPPPVYPPDTLSKDGGIKILPFSDVYSDMLVKHEMEKLKRKIENYRNSYNGNRNKEFERQFSAFKKHFYPRYWNHY